MDRDGSFLTTNACTCNVVRHSIAARRCKCSGTSNIITDVGLLTDAVAQRPTSHCVILSLSECRRNHQRRLCWRRQIRKPIHLLDGSLHHQPSLRKPATSINKLPMPLRLTSCSEKPEMRTRERRNAGRSVMKRTRPQTPGGMQLRLTREETLIVSEQCWAYEMVPSSSLPVAIQALAHTITHLTQGGRFRQAADREKEIGQIYLQELNDLHKACESFERAGEWYSQEDATA